MNEAALHDLISGTSRGVVPATCRSALACLSLFYGTGVRLRNQAFDIGLKRVHCATVPVVSVGNITTGGTGKTPMVAWVVQWFAERGVRPVILSRGYRSLPGSVNDEKLVLDQLCPGVPHVQNPDRVAAARVAVEEHAAQVLILDDGFQHRRLVRDLDIVLIDALNPFGYDRLLPRGLLREPLTGLRRADLIIVTRADQCGDDEKQHIVDRLAGIRGTDAHAEVAFVPECLINAAGETTEFGSLHDKPVTAFCGIGNPAAFERTIADCGLRIADFAPLAQFPDHYHYAGDDLAEIGERARQGSVSAIVTTQKDLVKINRDDLSGVPLWAIRIGAQVVHGGEQLTERLQEIAGAVSG